MPLSFPPKLGDVVMCEFPICFTEPEMVKKRACVVISSHFGGARGELVTIIPLSKTAPNPVMGYHCQIPVRLLPKYLQSTGGDRWAKCDMVYVLSTKRMELVSSGKDRKTGKRIYDKARLDLEHINKIRQCLAFSVGINADIFK